MVKNCIACFGIAVVLTCTSTVAQAQNAINPTGNWNISPSGEAFANGTVRLAQNGSAVVGSYGQNGRIEGKFEPGTLQVDANWTDSRGTGWMTIVFTANGNRFTGQWGRPGSKPSGQFVAVRSLYPRVTGVYNISVTSGTEFTTNRITLHQLALDVVGNYGPRTQLSGTMAQDANTMTGTWKGSSGSGWIKLEFADDSRSLQGTWGVTPGSEPTGQFTGSIVNTAQLEVRGLWRIASSGGAFSSDTLKLEQERQTVTGTFKDGRLQGTLPKGSHSLSGFWRDSRGNGVFTLTFAPDGMSFQGSWTRNNNNSGNVIGKRVIAASPALHR